MAGAFVSLYLGPSAQHVIFRNLFTCRVKLPAEHEVTRPQAGGWAEVARPISQIHYSAVVLLQQQPLHHLVHGRTSDRHTDLLNSMRLESGEAVPIELPHKKRLQ